MINAINPWSGARVEIDESQITQEKLDHYAQLIGFDECEAINNSFDHDPTPGEWLARWAERAGPEQAGLVIIGS